MPRYSYLFTQLVRRELRQKYQGSALGVLWYLVNPLMLMAVYGMMLGPLLKAVNIRDYPVFILAGLLVWLFFSQSLLSASTSLVEHAPLVSQVRFPRQTIPAAVVTVQLVPMAAMLIILVPLARALEGGVSASQLLLIPLLALLFAFTLGLALIVAALHAYFRDVQPIVTAVLLPLFFLSGVLFRLESLPGLQAHKWVEPLLRWVNPIAPFIEAVRSVLYDGRVPAAVTLLYVLLAALLSLGVGVLLFRRLDPELAVVL
ncbi:MAG: ABC transporter permease [Solirubrobacterales bacterium]|nr:ABC transporter permease [Solirubrobacterales bacterium]